MGKKTLRINKNNNKNKNQIKFLDERSIKN